MVRPVVLIESPYVGNPDALRYLACCLLDSIRRGEAPIASHTIYPLALPEHCEAYDGRTGREIGLDCRDNLSNLRHVDDAGAPQFVPCVCYLDLGVTTGMLRGGSYLTPRQLTGEAKRIWDAGEWPTQARLTHNHDVAGAK
jgi:hypothetical protein